MSELKFDPVTGQPINQPAAQPGMQPGMPNMQQPMGNGPKFDPVTGQPIQPVAQPGVQPGMPNMQQPMGNGPKFDPVTGQPIQPGVQPGMPNMQQPMGNGPRFNPNGQPMQPGPQPGMPNMQRVQQPMNNGVKFDPKTGKPMQPAGNNNGGGKKGLIIGLVLAGILVLGIGGFALASGSKKSAPVDESEPALAEASIEEVPEVEEITPEKEEDDEKELIAPTAATSAPEEDEKKEDEEEKKPVKSNAVVDPESMFAFNFDGTDYQLPIKVSDLIADGWSYYESSDAKELLAAGDYDITSFNLPDVDRSYISVTITNFSLNAEESQNCYVTEISFYSGSLDRYDKVVSVHNGDVVLGKSTPDEVKAIYGDPDYYSDTSSSYSITYYPGDDDYDMDHSLRFSFEDGVLEHISLENADEPENFEQVAVSDETPAYLANYKAPKELGSDPLSGNFKLDGELYTLPVPIQEFIDDGWSVGDKDLVVGAGQIYSITMRKGKAYAYIDAVNPTEEAVTLKNTIVTEISGYYSSSNKIDLEFPGSISFKMTEDEFKTTLKSNKIEKYEYKEKYASYRIPLDQSSDPSRARNYLNVEFDDNGKIDTIRLQNYGWLNN